jgi:hypothetical protein
LDFACPSGPKDGEKDHQSLPQCWVAKAAASLCGLKLSRTSAVSCMEGFSVIPDNKVAARERERKKGTWKRKLTARYT